MLIIRKRYVIIRNGIAKYTLVYFLTTFYFSDSNLIGERCAAH